jgi:RNA polymerase sigma factor (sigma-70 family)
MSAAHERGSIPPAPGAEPDRLFRQLVAEHQDRLYRFILKNIGNASDAEDLAQQAFVEAVKGFGSFRGDSQLSTWLYGIAMNLVRNYLSRVPHRNYRFEDDEALADLDGGSATPERQVQDRQSVALLQHELDGLAPEMREVLLMVSLDGLSYEEAAALLSVPVGTVRSRVSRARSQLRQRLAAGGIDLNF